MILLNFVIELAFYCAQFAIEFIDLELVGADLIFGNALFF
jgi:hypothetical protein